MALFGPSNLAVDSQSLVNCVLSWSPAPQAQSYKVYRDRNVIASGIITPLTFTDSSIVAGRRYTYAVTALVGGLETPGTADLRVDISPAANLTFEVVFQEQPGEGGYPDVLWRWK